MTDEQQTTATEPDLNEQMMVRRGKRERLLAEGREAYPTNVARTHGLAEVREAWAHLEAGEETQDVVSVTGRVIFVRNTGKLCFATLQDGLRNGHSGARLQVMLSLAEVGEESLADWKATVDLGDLVTSALAAWAATADAGGVGLTPELPQHPVRVRADAARVRQVVDGLVENALRVSPPGSRITVTVDASAEEATLVVVDGGPGLTPDDAARAAETQRVQSIINADCN